MRVPTILVISLASVLAGSLMLAGPLVVSNLFRVAHDKDKVPQAEAAPLPLNIMERFNSKRLAGDAESRGSLKIDEEFIDPEQHCEFCTRIEYTPGPQGLAGFAYESRQGIDLTSAKSARFWVMGEDGGERIKFKLAGKSLDRLQDRPSNQADRISSKSIFKSERFALNTGELRLDNDWKKYEVDLAGVDMKGITYPFGLEILKGEGKQVIYIKGVVYDTKPAEEPLAVIAEQAVEPLQAEIIANSTNGTAPSTIAFEANVTGGTEPYTITLNFGDGSEGQGSSVDHTFSDAGEYNVTLSAADSENQSAFDSVIVRVAEPEPEPEPEAAEEQGNQRALASASEIGQAPEDQVQEQDGNDTGDADAQDQPPEITEDAGQGLREGIQNLRLEADAGVDLAAEPGDTILLGGQVTGPGSDVINELSYEWTHASGPDVEISSADSLNPTVTIPSDLDRDSRIQLRFSASHESVQDMDSVTIFVNNVDEAEGAKEESLSPSEGEITVWNNECGSDIASCMSDDSDATFALASPDETSSANLFSFKEFDAGNGAEIEYVSAIVTAKKAGETGYLSLVMADSEDAQDYEDTPAISILSDSFEEYEYTWEENPATSPAWTAESLNSFLVGYMYAAGQSDIQVSEFSLAVTYVAEEPPVEKNAEDSNSEELAEDTAGNDTSG